MRGVVAQKEYAKLSRETTRVNVDDYELSVFFDCEDWQNPSSNFLHMVGAFEIWIDQSTFSN